MDLSPAQTVQDPDTPRTLGLVPEYGQPVNPYSEIGFPPQMNPYLEKKAMKAYWKQQKYLSKYGQYGLGGMGGMGGMGAPGGFYANDIDFD